MQVDDFMNVSIENDSISNKITDADKKLLSIISNKCSYILTEYKKTSKVLYRGIKTIKHYFIDKSPVNRMPTATDKQIQIQLDKQLFYAGFTALRSNSIFCTSKFTAARNYSSCVYVIFPIDGFDYMWCNTARDLTVTYDLYHIDITNNDIHNKFIRDLYNKTPIVFTELYGFENNTNISTAINKEFEVVIHGHYLAISSNYFFTHQFNKLLGI
jgi:hypothetical protein